MRLHEFLPFSLIQSTVACAAVSMAVSVAFVSIGTLCVAPVDALAASSGFSAPVHEVGRSAKPVAHKVARREKGAHRSVVAKSGRGARHAAPEAQARESRVYESYAAAGRSHHRAGVRRVAFARQYAQPQQRWDYGAPSGVGGGLGLRSSIAYVVDQNSLSPLYDKNSHVVTPIASITKLMTAMVALDSGISLDEPMTVTDADRDYEKGTGSRLSVGSVLSRRDMLHIALMASENRAAAALSRYYPGGRPAFIAAMNAKARQLGMSDTHFENSTGLTSQNVSSARDLVKMVNAAYQYPLIRQFSTDRSYSVYTGLRTLAYNSSNALVRNDPSWNIGLQKTGFINEAGECVVMQATIRGRPVIVVLLDSQGRFTRFADADRVRAWLDGGGDQSPNIVSVNDTGNGY